MTIPDSQRYPSKLCLKIRKLNIFRIEYQVNIYRNKQGSNLLKLENDSIFYVSDQIMVFMVSLRIEHYVIFALRVTWNYAYSPFKMMDLIKKYIFIIIFLEKSLKSKMSYLCLISKDRKFQLFEHHAWQTWSFKALILKFRDFNFL